MAFKETLDPPAAAAPVVEKPNTTTASMSGPSTEASFDLSKANKTETVEQNPETLAEVPEAPEAVVDRLAEEGSRVGGELAAFDKKAEASGKPLQNSEFLDRASLAKKSMSLQMLGMQKKLELAQASPNAGTEAGKAEIAKLSAERGAAVEQFKTQTDKAFADTTGRFAEGLLEEDIDMLSISSKSLAEGMKGQLKLRKELEGISLLGNEGEIKALVREAVAPEAAGEQGAATESVEDVVAQLRPDGVSAQEAGPTEQPDDEKREAMLLMSKAIALFMASQGKGPEKGLFDRMLENLKKLEGVGTKKSEAGAKKGIKEALGLGKDEKSETTQKELTSAALDKFLLGMADDKKGKSGGFFKNLLGKLGELAFVKKMKAGLTGGIGGGGTTLQGLTKLGAAGLGNRLAASMAPQFGKIDLGKKVEAPANEFEATYSQLQGINARLDARNKANPGEKDSPEIRAMEAEYAPVRAKFDKIRGVKDSEFAEAPKEATVEKSADKMTEQQEQDASENKVLDEMEKPENMGKGFEISPGIIQKIKERGSASVEAPAEEIPTLTPLEEEVVSEAPAAEAAPKASAELQ